MCARQSPVQNCGWHRPASLRGGMSLLELLVVIVIFGLLARSGRSCNPTGPGRFRLSAMQESASVAGIGVRGIP